jgi:hypothetical protein
MLNGVFAACLFAVAEAAALRTFHNVSPRKENA